MKTPVFPLLFIFIFQFNASFSQATSRNLLYFKSHAFSIGVSKNERPVIGTRGGEIAFPDAIKGLWCKTNISTGNVLNDLWIDQVCCFNADSAIVSGSISNNNKRKVICRTIDGGKNWTPIDFGMGGYVNDAAYLDNGEAWLGIQGTGIAYTTDYGVTWSSLAYPIKTELFNKIYFNTKREGIIGSLWNILAYTRDNCKTWIYLPTPLNQGKYRKIAFGARPQFNRVAIFNDYFLVSQENMVFYSKTDSVNWIAIPGYTDFYTDAANSALFLERSKGTFVKYDSHLQPVYSFKSTGKYEAAICRNASLFILGDDTLRQINAGNKLVVSPLYTNIEKETAPKSASIHNDYAGMNISDLKRFCATGVKTIIFSSGRDLYHGHEFSSDTMVYELKNNRFVLDRKVHKGMKFVDLEENASEIDKKLVDTFVKKFQLFTKSRQLLVILNLPGKNMIPASKIYWHLKHT